MSLWASLPPARRGLRCVVVMPVRNEAAHVQVALAALAAQTELDGRPFDRTAFEILCLANNCDDDSAALARRFARCNPDLQLRVAEVRLPPELANIGHVRACLMDEAYRRLELASSGTVGDTGRVEVSPAGHREAAPAGPDAGRHAASAAVIASTDSDSRVHPTWLANTLRELARGVDAVGGRILTDGADRPTAAALRVRRLDAVHALLRSRLADLVDPDPLDPWPRHHQHFGASLAVTARAYRLAGGVPPVAYLEDEALVRALRRVDLRVRHSPAVRVTTSGRLQGRAAVGLSWQLRQWAEGGADHVGRPVEPAQRYAQALAARRWLRTLWQRREQQDLRVALRAPTCDVARTLGLDAQALADTLAASSHFGAAWERIEQHRHAAAADAADWVPLPLAVAQLRTLVRHRLVQPGAENKSRRNCA